jgi:plastocyanin
MRTIIAVLGLVIISWATQAAASSVVINQNNKKFEPKTVNIKVGDTLVFKNTEKRKRRHNVYTKAAAFKYVKIKTQNRGESNEIKITNAGTFEVLCAFHPKMKMTVNVTK